MANEELEEVPPDGGADRPSDWSAARCVPLWLAIMGAIATGHVPALAGGIAVVVASVVTAICILRQVFGS